MRKIVALVAALMLAGSAMASFTIYDITADPAGWAAALSANNLVAAGGWDFSRDPSYPIVGIDGPLTYLGKPPVSPGTIDFTGVQMFGRDNLGSQDLVTVGPGAGYGNPLNAVLANFFVDTFVMDFEDIAAVEFNAMSLLGTNVITITAGTSVFPGLAAPPAGRKYGLIAPGAAIGDFRVTLYDVGGGAEGVQGWGQVYVPEPASLALLGLAALVMRRR